MNLPEPDFNNPKDLQPMVSEIEIVGLNVSQNVESDLLSLIRRFGEVLARRPHVLRCFADQGVQVEGWLKGEFLAFLTEERLAARIADFHREHLIGTGKRKADLCLHGAEQSRIWIELKHYLIGMQKGIQYNALGYFTDPRGGIKPDIEKLLSIDSPHRYVLILATARPTVTDWAAAIERFNSKFVRCLRPLTSPDEFPGEFFLGLVSVEPPAAT